MPRPSEPLIKLIRDWIATRGRTVADVAQAAGIERSRLRKVLSGSQPMQVDELVRLGEVLELTPDVLGMASAEVSDDAPPALVDATESAPIELHPYANQPEALVRVGFALSVDFLFTLDTSQLADAGFPDQVLSAYRDRDLPIKLDALYHEHNAPAFHPDAFQVNLSFDALYTCRIPWSAIKQVVFFPMAPEVDPPDEQEDDEPGDNVVSLFG